MNKVTLTVGQVNALRELADRNELHLNIRPTRDGVQVGMRVSGNPACEVVYTSWKRPGYRLDIRSKDRAELGKAMRAIIVG